VRLHDASELLLATLGRMRVLICGSRSWRDTEAVKKRVDMLPEGTVVIQGGATGADSFARHYATLRGLFVAEVAVSKPYWERYGKSAGHKRNHAMLDLQPDLVIAFQRNGSNGTQGTLDEACRRGIPVEVHRG
jgi:hypothetical protein